MSHAPGSYMSLDLVSCSNYEEQFPTVSSWLRNQFQELALLFVGSYTSIPPSLFSTDFI